LQDLGLTKLFMTRLIESNTAQARKIIKLVDDVLREACNLAEHPRRPRTCDQMPRYKGHEWNFLGMSVFPLLFNELLDFETDDLEVWRCHTQLL
jgi:hypothetical protein